MVKIIAWSVYDLGEVYGFNIKAGDNISSNIGSAQVDITYLRLVFTFSTMIPENLETMNINGIQFGTLNEYTGYFTSDITAFPSESIEKLKSCIGDEMEALINSNVDIPVMKQYINWFMRNVDTTDSKYVDIVLDRMMMMFELDHKNGAPIRDIYKMLTSTHNPMKYKILDLYEKYIASPNDGTKFTNGKI